MSSHQTGVMYLLKMGSKSVVISVWFQCMTFSSVNSRFPKDVAVRQQWLREIRRDNFTPSGTSVICSDHYEESCYVAT